MTDLQTHAGGGVFGHWIADDFGLPAFRYTLDQLNDPAGRWNRHSTFPDPSMDDASGRSHLHWHQIGNDRYQAIASNDGWAQLYSHEFGPRWINMYRPEQQSYAGGISYLEVDGKVLSTLYQGEREGVEIERVWGCSYSQITIETADIRLKRTIFAPFGDSPFLMAHVQVTNLTDRALSLRHLEYWDLHPHDIYITGPVPWMVDRDVRDERSKVLYSEYSGRWDAQLGALVAEHPWRRIIDQTRNWPGGFQRIRPDIVLVPMQAGASRAITDRQLLFASGDPGRPDILVNGEPGELRESRQARQRDVLVDPRLVSSEIDDTPDDMSELPVLSLLTEHTIPAGGEVKLGYAYGVLPADEVDREIASVRSTPVESIFQGSMQAWRDFLPRAELHDPALERELAWGAYYVRSGAVYHRNLQAHTLLQGGAYQYISGVNAGPRATLQHMLPLIWLAPDLGKDILR